MRSFSPWLLLKLFYPKAVFRIKTSEKILYLTFDDGPDPVSTTLILDMLEQKGAKAIFFCSGRKAEMYPELIKMIKQHGHVVGNHCYNHLNGLKTPTNKYCEDADRAAGLTSDKIFRPPYGRMKLSQYRLLSRKYRVFMWDLMSYDYDQKFGAKRTLDFLKAKIRPGSVIVFHDKKSSSALMILTDFLEFCKVAGYRFEIPYSL
jgi:peptidoglycan/xylan/chitin deacetylase (PgdA/CDA1 family)